MSIKQIEIMISVLPVIIGILTFLIILSFSITYHPEKMLFRTFERVNNRLRERNSGFFSYEKTEQFLNSTGAKMHLGAWINPIRYLALRLCVSALLFGVGMKSHGVLAVILALIGYQAPSILLLYLNRQDNNKMITDIQTLYNTLKVQIMAGVYISDALRECYGGIKEGRLRTALEELSNELFVRNSFETAVDNFGSKFSNGTIDTMCIILKQAQESGQAVSLLGDMSEQIKDMQAALLLRKKEKLNRAVTICILGIMSAIIGIIIYTFILSMYSSASAL